MHTRSNGQLTKLPTDFLRPIFSFMKEKDKDIQVRFTTDHVELTPEEFDRLWDIICPPIIASITGSFPHHEKPLMEVRVFTNDDKLYVEVSDNGCCAALVTHHKNQYTHHLPADSTYSAHDLEFIVEKGKAIKEAKRLAESFGGSVSTSYGGSFYCRITLPFPSFFSFTPSN